MSDNSFPGQRGPGDAPGVPRYPRPQYLPAASGRRWPAIAGTAAASAAITAIVATLITARVAGTGPGPQRVAAPTVTVTATASPKPAPPAQSPLPTGQADRQTCNAWRAAGDRMHAAVHALSVLPKGMTIADQTVHDHPDWSAAVQAAAALYGQASDTMLTGVTAGSTPILSETATTVAAALRALSTADATVDPAGGNAYNMMHEASDAMDVLCERLAPQ